MEFHMRSMQGPNKAGDWLRHLCLLPGHLLDLRIRGKYLAHQRGIAYKIFLWIPGFAFFFCM